MPYVVTEPCRDCKYTDCVTVCPCECFYQDEFMLYIDPDHCIDCDACRVECPVDAIYHDVEVPPRWEHYIELNAERCRAVREGVVTHIIERQDPKEGSRCRKR
jgi:ferredoxin